MSEEDVGRCGYEDAEEFRIRAALRATPAERLADLEAMIDFNARVEERNPRIKRVAEALSRRERQ